MKNDITKNLVEGNLIQEKRTGDLLQYNGWNNGYIWEFYGLNYENEEDMDGHFDKENKIRLTKSELKDYKIYD